MATKVAGNALAGALAVNSVLKVLDVSSNLWDENSNGDKLGGDGPGFAEELAVGLGTNGAMTSLNVSDNKLGPEGAKHIAAALPGCK